MNHQQRVYNLLAKVGNVNLKQERKVNMSMVDELQALIDRLEDAFIENNKSVSELNKAAENVSFTAMDVLLLWEQVESAASEVESSLNELGVEPFSIPAIARYLQIGSSDEIENVKSWQQEADRLL